MRAARCRLGFIALALVGLAAGCVAEPSLFEFSDKYGRRCQMSCDSQDCDWSCDSDPAPGFECPDEDRACYTLSQSATDYEVVSLCDSCCGEYGSIFVASDCVPLDCRTDDDCPPWPTEATCDARGFCRRVSE